MFGYTLDKVTKVSGRQTVRNRTMLFEENYFLGVKSLLQICTSTVLLTADEWSSSIYKGNMAVTGHWIDKEWNMWSAVLYFERFMTPYTGEATCAFLCDVISQWGRLVRVSIITTESTGTLVKGVELLRRVLCVPHPGKYTVVTFHVRCVAHVINLSI